VFCQRLLFFSNCFSVSTCKKLQFFQYLFFLPVPVVLPATCFYSKPAIFLQLLFCQKLLFSHFLFFCQPFLFFLTCYSSSTYFYCLLSNAVVLVTAVVLATVLPLYYFSVNPAILPKTPSIL
jgi:hypothetical protein